MQQRVWGFYEIRNTFLEAPPSVTRTNNFLLSNFEVDLLGNQ